MTVYLGTFGKIELRREFDGSEITGTIKADDVNTSTKRFSFDFDHGQLLTGDQIEITSTDDSALDFIDSYTDSSVKKFIYVDELDGIRLYDSFANAVTGGSANATSLATPGNDIPIEVKVENSDYRVVAQVNSYELNTERETVDTTTLSDEFRSRISTLMSGSGQMSAEWEYTGNTAEELANYLLELQIRTQVGSQFKARFYIKTKDYNPSGVTARANDELWYEFNGVLTNCAVRFEVGSIVQITANFITTGEIQIRMDLETADDVTTEDGDEVVLDQDDTANLELDGTE